MKALISISEIQIIPVKPKDGLVAFASCIINNQFYIGDIAIHTSPSATGGFRLVYPLKTLPTGKQINCIHPINRETGDLITKAIVSKYKDLIEKVTKNDKEALRKS